MAGRQAVAGERLAVCISPSVENWRDKLEAKFGAKEGSDTDTDPTVFVGLYRPRDHKKFLAHKGRKAVYWCGSDILLLREISEEERGRIAGEKASHWVENYREAETLYKTIGVKAGIHPFLVEKLDWEPSFKPSPTPHVFLNCRPGSELEYGLGFLPVIAKAVPEVTFHVYGGGEFLKKFGRNIAVHGEVSEKRFNEEIRGYQAGLRLNLNDGFSEVLWKSILLGQHPISQLYYPRMDWFASDLPKLIYLLQDLKNKKEPNPHREWWIKEVNTMPNLFL